MLKNKKIIFNLIITSSENEEHSSAKRTLKHGRPKDVKISGIHIQKTRGEDEGVVLCICTGFTAAGKIKRPPR